MPTALDLINCEKIAAIIFIISSFQALGSAFKAEQAELEKQQSTTGSANAVVATNKLALNSTVTGTIGFLIYLIVAIIRKAQLQQEIQSNTTNVSIIPNIFIVSGFIISVLGNLMRIPAIQQRLDEALRPVVL